MQADYVLDYDVVSVAKEQHVYLMARIKAGESSSLVARRPLNLSVVLDRSGSMGGDKIDYVRKAAGFLVQHLGASDRFSVVSYSSTVTVELEPAPVIHKDVIKQRINNISAGGSTNLSGGWLQGCQLVAQSKKEGQINRVLLLTDGLANEGVTDPRRLAAMARQKREEGITTTTMGVGMGFNEDLLVQMASEGGGAFYFIDNPDQAPTIFSEELQDLLDVVGQNLVLTLTLSEDVKMIRQLNTYPADIQGRQAVFRMSDLYADEIKTLLIELHIPALEQLGEVEVARMRFEYDELGPETVTHRELEIPIVVNAVPEEELDTSKPNQEVVKSALLLRAARAREEAVKQADAGDFKQATQTLTDIAEEIQTAGISDEDLQKEHDMLREEAVDMEFGSQRYDSYTRKSHTSKIFHTTSSRPKHREAQTVILHQRMKASRDAIERDGDTPGLMTWKQEMLDLKGVDKLTFGRGTDNDIVIQEVDVSEYHAQLLREGDDLFLVDLQSTNGTFANGGLIQGRFRLSVGDVVSIGSWLFMLKAGEQPAE